MLIRCVLLLHFVQGACTKKNVHVQMYVHLYVYKIIIAFGKCAYIQINVKFCLYQ